MTFHRDERAASKAFVVLLQDLRHILPDVLRADVVEAKLDDARQFRLGLKKEFCEVKVVSQHNGVIFFGPAQDVGVRCIRRSKLAPMAGGVAVLTKIPHPRDRQAVVNDDGHAGCSSISRSRVSQEA